MQLGLTGNIATGKSTVFKHLLSLEGVVGFDADAVVHQLYRTDEVKQELMSAFGEQIVRAEGEVDRAVLRQLFLSQDGVREQLEAIFHPKVHAEYEQLTSQKSEGQVLVADIPLLFEKQVPYEFDKTIVVACGATVQLERLQSRSGLDRETAQAMINKQVALSSKIDKADHVIWNNGDLAMLQRQIDSLVYHIFNECREYK